MNNSLSDVIYDVCQANNDLVNELLKSIHDLISSSVFTMFSKGNTFLLNHLNKLCKYYVVQMEEMKLSPSNSSLKVLSMYPTLMDLVEDCDSEDVPSPVLLWSAKERMLHPSSPKACKLCLILICMNNYDNINRVPSPVITTNFNRRNGTFTHESVADLISKGVNVDTIRILVAVLNTMVALSSTMTPIIHELSADFSWLARTSLPLAQLVLGRSVEMKQCLAYHPFINYSKTISVSYPAICVPLHPRQCCWRKCNRHLFHQTSFSCSECRCVWYCSKQCQRDDWTHSVSNHKSMCRDYKIADSHRVSLVVSDLPYFNELCELVEHYDCHDSMIGVCYFLYKHGLHGCDAWKSLCRCGAYVSATPCVPIPITAAETIDDRSSTIAKDEKETKNSSNENMSWIGNSKTNQLDSILCLKKKNRIQQWLPSHTILSSWKQLYECFNLPVSSPAALLLTYPLSVASAIHLCTHKNRYNINKCNDDKTALEQNQYNTQTLIIHLIGCEIEASFPFDIWNIIPLVLSPLNIKNIHICIIGPSVSLNQYLSNNTTLLKGLTLSYHQGFYHDVYSSLPSLPASTTLIIALNPGVDIAHSSYSWRSSMSCIKSSSHSFIFTELCWTSVKAVIDSLEIGHTSPSDYLASSCLTATSDTMHSKNSMFPIDMGIPVHEWIVTQSHSSSSIIRYPSSITTWINPWRSPYFMKKRPSLFGFPFMINAYMTIVSNESQCCKS